MFYIVLTALILLSQYIFQSFLGLFIIFGTTWFPQIISNYQKGTAQLSLKYVWTVSLGRLYFVFYLGLCPDNLLSIKPKPIQSFILILILLIQVGLLHLQKSCGAKCILPRVFKKQPYNYYIDINNENREKFNNDCIICLENLVKITIITESDEYNREFFENTKYSFYNCVKKKTNQFVSYFKYSNTKLPYMMTPCNHFFHSDCLELWIEKKLECPFCRSKIPALE